MGIRHGPPRGLFKYRNHYELIPFSVDLLQNDGIVEIHEIFTRGHRGQKYLTALSRGARDADLPWSCGYIVYTYHYHHPWTHRGYLTYRSAADVIAGLFVIGQDLWTRGRRRLAVYQLGRMLHLLQDLFIPHHAAVTVLHGHGELEEWLDSNWRRYVVHHGGYYSWEGIISGEDQQHTVSSQNPYDWVDAASHISMGWYRNYFESGHGGTDGHAELVSKIIPNTLRYSAGFIRRFFIGLTL